jgi:hypothetical protein
MKNSECHWFPEYLNDPARDTIPATQRHGDSGLTSLAAEALEQ